MDMDHSQEEKKEIIGDFLQKMADSGYKHPSRKEIIKSAVKKYYRQLLEQETGGRKLYRSAEDMAETRKMKSLMNRSWFKSKRGGSSITSRKDLPHIVQKQELDKRRERGGNKKDREVKEEPGNREDAEESATGEKENRKVKEIETVIFVPATPGSALKETLQKVNGQAPRSLTLMSGSPKE